FRGEYPIGKVKYSDPNVPLEVSLEAFFFFFLTAYDKSENPAVVMEYVVKNTSDRTVTFDFVGWLQNMSHFQTAKNHKGTHVNTVVKKDGLLQVNFDSEIDSKGTTAADYGNMSLTLLDPSDKAFANPQMPGGDDVAYNMGLTVDRSDLKTAKAELGEKIVGTVGEEITLEPNQSKKISYIISWYFPNVSEVLKQVKGVKGGDDVTNYYTANYSSSSDVAEKLYQNKEELFGATKDWNKTYYNSTLPYWFLDRVFVPASTFATRSMFRLNDPTDDFNKGRFYALEGTMMGPGTCTHVFHYEQAMGRLFPNLSRQMREQVDYNPDLAWFEKDGRGYTAYRAESRIGSHDGRSLATDGSCGTILRMYREHLMSPDKTFLNKNYDKIKKSIKYLIHEDQYIIEYPDEDKVIDTGAPDGILEGNQYNTLDKIWRGKIPWISGLYNAVLLAGEQMALEMNDKAFAKQCAKIAKLGAQNISEELFNGEYYQTEKGKYYKPTPNSFEGCHMDQ
ncbi:MAG: hypothetical protein MI799_10475, partial [Desulfobacterales bacterium]|nr:hypothetical protein [Desulfobacterales bacterium]